MLRFLCVAIVAATASLVVAEVVSQPCPYANPVPVEIEAYLEQMELINA